MSSEDSLYARYKHGKYISTPPTSAWSLGGIGSVPTTYPLSFKTEGFVTTSWKKYRLYSKLKLKIINFLKGSDKISEEEKRNKTGFVGGKTITPTEDVLTVLYQLFFIKLQRMSKYIIS